MGELFEQFVGLEIIRLARLRGRGWRLRFWRDPDGPEIDWVLEREGKYLPIEVKLTDRPSLKDARHLLVFMKEYKAKKGLVICTSPRAVRLSEAVTAVPWQDLAAAIGGSL